MTTVSVRLMKLLPDDGCDRGGTERRMMMDGWMVGRDFSAVWGAWWFVQFESDTNC